MVESAARSESPDGTAPQSLESDQEQVWRAFLVEQNRRGFRFGVIIGIVLDLLFVAGDFLVAPPEKLPYLLAIRAVMVGYLVPMLFVARRPVFSRHSVAFTCSIALVLAFGVAFMVFILGGFGSPYYAGLSLIMVGAGVFFNWPTRVAAPVHTTIVLSFVIPGIATAHQDLLTLGAINLIFLVSTAVVVVASQTLTFQTKRRQIYAEVHLDRLRQAEAQARKAVEEKNSELTAAYDKLKDLDRLKNQFFANVSHELRTPLTLILASLRRVASGQDAFDAARLGLRNASRLLILINDLLDLARLEDRRGGLAKRTVDLSKLVRQVASNFDSSARSERVSLDLGDEKIIAEIDSRLLKTALYNLLSNALKFNDPDKGRVWIRVRQADATAKIEVRDNGIGIAEVAIGAIFERFSQVEAPETRQFGGTGIGLALVKEIVEAHDGKVEVASKVGEGTTFTVCLPIGHPDREDLSKEGDALASDAADDLYRQVARAPETRAATQVTAPRTRPGAARVVIVEDNDDLREYLARVLGEEFDVALARDGLEGLDLALRVIPEVVVTDDMMPRMSGRQLLDAMRRDESLKKTAVVLVTARADAGARTAALEAGADDYICKPFDEGELLARVRNLVRAQAQERQLAELNQRLTRLNDELARLATVDAVTLVLNRRGLDDALDQLWREATAGQFPMSLIMCDIDHFKAYNDTYGHQAGDDCLAQVAGAIRRASYHPRDVVGRYGGEEFCVALPNTDIEGAERVAGRVCDAVRALEIRHAGAMPSVGIVSLSAGVATLVPRNGWGSSRLVQAADAALLRAKAEGRNRFVVADH